MKQVYVLIPLLQCDTDLQAEISKIMKIDRSQFEVYVIAGNKFAVKFYDNQLGYAELQEIMQLFEQQSRKIKILEDNLVNYDWNSKQSSVHNNSIDSLMKKAIKYKEIKQENKKLKKLLQNQLENTQKIREQTQKTMKVLREEFDTLVRQMSKQNNEKDKHKTTQKNIDKHEHYEGRVLNKF